MESLSSRSISDLPSNLLTRLELLRLKHSSRERLSDHISVFLDSKGRVLYCEASAPKESLDLADHEDSKYGVVLTADETEFGEDPNERSEDLTPVEYTILDAEMRHHGYQDRVSTLDICAMMGMDIRTRDERYKPVEKQLEPVLACMLEEES